MYLMVGKINRKCCRYLLFILVIFLFPINSFANYVHVYQGEEYNGGESVWPLGMYYGKSLSGSFTTLNPLEPNSRYYSQDVLSFSFYDGLLNYSSSGSGYIEEFIIDTDNAANITGWNVLLGGERYDKQYIMMVSIMIPFMPSSDILQDGPL